VQGPAPPLACHRLGRQLEQGLNSKQNGFWSKGPSLLLMIKREQRTKERAGRQSDVTRAGAWSSGYLSLWLSLGRFLLSSSSLIIIMINTDWKWQQTGAPPAHCELIWFQELSPSFPPPNSLLPLLLLLREVSVWGGGAVMPLREDEAVCVLYFKAVGTLPKEQQLQW
jgi:hypothetical protein